MASTFARTGKISMLVIVLLGLLLLIPTVSALELNPFADTKAFTKVLPVDTSDFIKSDFNSKYGLITLNSNFMWIETGKVAEYTLTKNTELCIINCEAEGRVTLYSDSVLFDDKRFIDLKTGLDTSIQSSKYLLFDGYKDNYVSVPDTYKDVCVDVIDNKTLLKEKSCRQEVDTYKQENQPLEVWKEYNGEELVAGDYRWKIKGVKERTQDIDFIPIKDNKEFSEWATWTSSFNTGLQAYLSMNETGNLIDSVAGIYNTTCAQATLTGKFNNSKSFESAGCVIPNSAGFMSNNSATFSFWFYETSTGFVEVLSASDKWLIGTFNDGKVSYYDTVNNWQTASVTYPQNTWVHYVMVKNGTVVTLYTNATLVKNGSLSAWVTTNNVTIGKGQILAAGVYNLDELAIWNRSLSQAEVTDLYNDGIGMTYIPTAPPANMVITINQSSPFNNTNSSATTMWFSSNASVTNGNFTNATLYLQNGVTYTNFTTISPTNLTSVNLSISNIPSGLYNWSYSYCSINATGTICNYTNNFTILFDSTKPNVNIVYPTVTTYNTNVSVLNYTVSDLHLQNCSYSLNLGVTNTSVVCGTNLTGLTSNEGSNTWIVYANDSFGNLNSSSVTFFKNIIRYSFNYNSTVTELTPQTFVLSVNSTTSTSINATLNYNNTNYNTTKTIVGSNTIFTAQINMSSVSTDTVIPINWTIDVDTYITKFNVTQTIEPMEFSICDNAVFNTTFINFTFFDETTLAAINASISTFNLNYSTTGSSETYVYQNATSNPNYAVCAIPRDETFSTTYTLDYFLTGYPQRHHTNILTLTNTTTNKVLYLLATADGIYTTFQVINNAEQPLTGVKVNATRTIGSVTEMVAEGITGSDGLVTFWLNPNAQHTFTFQKDGYDIYTSSIYPTQSSYTVNLGSATSSGGAVDYTRGISYTILPSGTQLVNNTIYNFNLTMVTTYWNIESWGYNLVANNTVVATQSSSASGGFLSNNYDVGNYSLITMKYYFVVNSTYTNYSRSWLIFNSYDTGWSIKTFFEDLFSYVSSGIFGITNFGLAIFTFLFIFIFVGIMSFKFGLNSPSAIVAMIFGLVLFFDVGLNWTFLNPVEAIPHFLTILVGLITFGVVIQEATQ